MIELLLKLRKFCNNSIQFLLRNVGNRFSNAAMQVNGYRGLQKKKELLDQRFSKTKSSQMRMLFVDALCLSAFTKRSMLMIYKKLKCVTVSKHNMFEESLDSSSHDTYTESYTILCRERLRSDRHIFSKSVEEHVFVEHSSNSILFWKN